MIKYQMHMEMSAAFNHQQMLDRDAGRLELASWCQQNSAKHYVAAQKAKEEGN